MEPAPKHWRKNLYENRNLPDNYTDASFLEELRKNVKPNDVTTSDAIRVGAGVSIKISIVTLFFVVFTWLDNQWASPDSTFLFSCILTIAGYIVYAFKAASLLQRLRKDIPIVVIFLAFSYILSPVLKTLTETISTNTIYATTTVMFLTHLTFSRYGLPQVSLSDSLAVTSSIFGSLMLASRLATPLCAFTLLTIATQFFVLLPFLLSKVTINAGISLSLTVVTLYFLICTLSFNITCIYLVIVAFVHIICPLWYIRWQKYKDNIYGPWDEAVISY